MFVLFSLLKSVYYNLRRLCRVERKMLRFASKKVKIHNSCDVSSRSIFEGANVLYPGAHFDGELGYGSYISDNSHIQGKVGKYTSIGRNVVCNPGRHPYKEPYVSTSPIFVSTERQCGVSFTDKSRFEEMSYADKEKQYVVEIGNDCWLGEGVFMVGGVRIADGAMVLANAVVTKDVPPYAIVGGVPAKIVGYRYDEGTIQKLLETKWWDKDIEWLKSHVDEMCDISSFLNNQTKTNG